uniref:Cytochrome b n=1 Tax=Acanthocardia tuberculata TaxID=385555 RepID=Q06SA2_ACATU|nr:cytochrome b [Acanthocardia tuberculata]ABF60136.1 cytochrome b [Acanthocardia tuberculata]
MYINRKKGVLKFISSALYDLPVPKNLNFWWNFGSMLGVCLISQILSGLLLVVHYTPHVDLAFDSVCHIVRDVPNGWFLRSYHANGATMFFVCLYIHMGRGLYYHSFYFTKTWMIGVSLYLFSMAEAFFGYVLPWGQMSYWGATVITNLLTAIPYIGDMLAQWVWGGYTIGDPTLKRFFVLHFLVPFLMLVMVMIHILYLHDHGSSNPLGVSSDLDWYSFPSYYSTSDLVGILGMVSINVGVCLVAPDYFGNAANFIKADPMKTPIHIQPEWYFLFAYSILRSIPSKGGGAFALLMSVTILYFLPLTPRTYFRGLAFNVVGQVYYWLFVVDFVLLSWVGTCPVEEPYILLGQCLTVFYFSYFLTAWKVCSSWEYISGLVKPNLSVS